MNNLYADLTILEQTKKILLFFCQVRIGGALLKKTEKKRSKILCKVIHIYFLPHSFLELHESLSIKNLKCLIKLPNSIDEVNEVVSKLCLSHGFPWCLGAVDRRHVNIKKPKTNANDYMNRKSHYSFFNSLMTEAAAADYQYLEAVA